MQKTRIIVVPINKMKYFTTEQMNYDGLRKMIDGLADSGYELVQVVPNITNGETTYFAILKK